MGVMVLSGLCAWAVCPQKEAMQVGGGRMLTVHCHAGGQFVRAIASSAKGVPEMSCPGCDVL